jgi:transposase
VEAASVVAEMSPTEKMRQFKMIMGEIIEEAIKNNNEELCQTMGETVSDKVLKQMDYLARTKEEKDEERFRRFDEAVREIQKSRQEAATAENSKGKGKNKGKEKKKRGFFGH